LWCICRRTRSWLCPKMKLCGPPRYISRYPRHHQYPGRSNRPTCILRPPCMLRTPLLILEVLSTCPYCFQNLFATLRLSPRPRRSTRTICKALVYPHPTESRTDRLLCICLRTRSWLVSRHPQSGHLQRKYHRAKICLPPHIRLNYTRNHACIVFRLCASQRCGHSSPGQRCSSSNRLNSFQYFGIRCRNGRWFRPPHESFWHGHTGQLDSSRKRSYCLSHTHHDGQ
jgi:hypothetical protein